MKEWATRYGHIIRFTKDVMANYKGGRNISVNVEDNKIIITKGYDYTLTDEARGGAHFGARPLLRQVQIPESERLRTEVTKDKIVIYLEEVA